MIPALLAGLILSAPTFATEGDYQPINLALTPGADETELNFAWISPVNAAGECAVELSKNGSHFSGSNVFISDKKQTLNRVFTGSTKQAKDTIADYYYCKVTIDGLRDNSEYHYRIGDNLGVWSVSYNYSTENRNSYGFVYLADAQIGASRSVPGDTEAWTGTVELINEHFPESAFILSAGDQIENPGHEDEWSGFFEPLQNESPLPLAPIPAAHDQVFRGMFSEATIYHFNLPNESERFTTEVDTNACDAPKGPPPGERPPPGGRPPLSPPDPNCTPEPMEMELAGDYSFRYGDVLFIGLDMDSKDYAAHGNYIAHSIAANPDAKWRIVSWHYTIFSAVDQSRRRTEVDSDELTRIMDDNHIDVVLMGHDHSYCRTYPMFNGEVQEEKFNQKGESINPKGVVYFTANSSSGSKYYNFSPDVEEYDFVAAYSQPYVPMLSYIEVGNSTLSIKTYETENMDVIDSYTIKKTRR